MVLWNENMRISKREQERINLVRSKNIVPEHRGFYDRIFAAPRENYLGSPENRRAAGFSIRDD